MTQKERIELLEKKVLNLEQRLWVFEQFTQLPDGVKLGDFIDQKQKELNSKEDG